jgi:hypothetical protein
MRLNGKLVRVLPLVILLVSLVVSLSACGGGAASTPTRPAATVTPSIQSTVQVTPASQATATPMPQPTTSQPASTSQPMPTPNPTIVPSQGLLPPHRFFGTGMLDGTSVADGTVVTALIDGAEVARTTTSGGRYRIDVIQPQGKSFDGKTVNFTLKDRQAAQTGRFGIGEVSEVNLTVGP